jgi:hypothetical protein
MYKISIIKTIDEIKITTQLKKSNSIQMNKNLHIIGGSFTNWASLPSSCWTLAQLLALRHSLAVVVQELAQLLAE